MITTSSLNAAVSYKKDALPIFQNRCSQCHNPSAMPDKNWLEYDIAKSKKALILNRVWIKRDMPMGGNITEDERQIIKNWIEGGAQP